MDTEVKTSIIPKVSVAEIREAQLADEVIGPVLKWKESGPERPKWEEVAIRSAALKTYWSQWEVLAVKEGVLMKKWESENGRVFKWLLVLPQLLREKMLRHIITFVKDSRTSGKREDNTQRV